MACLRSIHHVISKLLGGLEYRNEARFNHNFLVGPWVSCGTGSTFLHAERSKAPDLDPVLLHECILDYTDKAIDHSFCFYFRKSGASCDTIDNVSLCHFCWNGLCQGANEKLEWSSLFTLHAGTMVPDKPLRAGFAPKAHIVRHPCASWSQFDYRNVTFTFLRGAKCRDACFAGATC